jgi:tetratricopeptide (TPR) repeat protein
VSNVRRFIRRFEAASMIKFLRAGSILLIVFAAPWGPAAAIGGVPPDPEALHRQGLEAMAAGSWPAAVDALETATAAAPDDLVIGTDYRQAVIGAASALKSMEPYTRCLAFFEKLVADHPRSANAYLNYGFANVDKIPVEGAITQVILADKALTLFSKALEIEPSWLGYYSRGHAYLYWPPIFGRVASGVSDLEQAVAISEKKADHEPYYARAWAALGDGYWRQDDVPRAREVWKQGLKVYPNDPELNARYSRSERSALDAFLEAHYDTTARVSTNLNEIFGDRLATLEKK